MSHEILIDAQGRARFMTYGKPAWHFLGPVIQEKVCATEGAKIAGADFDLEKRTLTVEVGGGQTLEVPGRKALVRTGGGMSPEVIEIVNDGYPVMSNMDLARLLDPITEAAGWPIESVGVLHRGGSIFFVLRAGTVSLDNDEIRDYYTVYERRDGGHQLMVFYSPIKAVCANTIAAAMDTATTAVRVRHTEGTFAADTAFYVDLLARLRDVRAPILQQFQTMERTKLVNAQVEAILAATYPEPTLPSVIRQFEQLQAAPTEQDMDLALVAARATDARKANDSARERVYDLRVLARNVYERISDEEPYHAGTEWALYNAVVEVADHRPGRGTDASIATSALFGLRAGEKARCLSAITGRAN